MQQIRKTYKDLNPELLLAEIREFVVAMGMKLNSSKQETYLLPDDSANFGTRGTLVFGSADDTKKECSIDGFSHLLMDDYSDKLDETAKEYLARVRHASQRMGNLIDDLLALARVGRQQLNFSKVNLSEMVRQISARLQDSEPARRCTWKIAPHLSARADSSLIYIVLDNLLSNAWKYTSKVSHAHIEVGVLNENRQSVFYVSDNGAGFDIKYADKLFVPFQRLHQANEFEGTGVGLATVQRIIRRHGGQIWAESEPGKGSRFYFTVNGANH